MLKRAIELDPIRNAPGREFAPGRSCPNYGARVRTASPLDASRQSGADSARDDRDGAATRRWRSRTPSARTREASCDGGQRRDTTSAHWRSSRTTRDRNVWRGISLLGTGNERKASRASTASHSSRPDAAERVDLARHGAHHRRRDARCGDDSSNARSRAASATPASGSGVRRTRRGDIEAAIASSTLGLTQSALAVGGRSARIGAPGTSPGAARVPRVGRVEALLATRTAVVPAIAVYVLIMLGEHAPRDRADPGTADRRRRSRQLAPRRARVGATRDAAALRRIRAPGRLRRAAGIARPAGRCSKVGDDWVCD